MQEVRAAVIGTGVMGRKYAQMIAEGKAGALRLTAVVCRSAGAQQWAKDTLPDTVRVCPAPTSCTIMQKSLTPCWWSPRTRPTRRW